ncbi:hypothetical protein [Pseudoalteromonas tunicata]|uniref:hypothetical protein n=1 Tax=Pseudoalteromonas tunicata TaxID=314281 RepID=UPI00273D5F29|nr:hypothetical protein [Pseudoalteromonas tunicata]MDP4983669.1 hypothetical protein [Pseudoalteromonas tunicata]
MKVLLIAASLMSAGVMASEPTPAELAKFKIVSAAQVAQMQENVQINGKVYTRKATPKMQALTQEIDLPKSVVIGEVVSSDDGFTSYQVTGEIIVKLKGNVDFTAFNQKNNLTIKQAYQEYYVLKAADKSNLLTLVNQLTTFENVESATIDLADLTITTH